jgi:hypothetical protein
MSAIITPASQIIIPDTAIRPQPGFQVQALSSSADIAILGAAAGVGKSWTLLMESGRNVEVPGFTGIGFRRTSPQIRNPGGLLAASRKLMPALGGKLRENEMEWRFPIKGDQETPVIKLSHLQYDSDVEAHQGAEYCLIFFDELTHFTESQFWYMLSRNRSTCGVRPYIRASCNPDPDSFVASLVEWYIDQETGYPIPERNGVLRYFIRVAGVIVWGNSKQEVYEQVKNDDSFREVMEASAAAGISWKSLIKSFTFISGSIYENKKLLSVNPEYLASLLSLEEKEQDQLLRGNWKISQDGMALAQYRAVKDMFNNYKTPSQQRWITADVSRFGRDFTVIMVWVGWTVVKITIWYQTEAHECVQYIDMERQRWGVVRSHVVVDQDGPIGSAVRQKGDYMGFSGGHPALPNYEAHIKQEQYENVKTQCAYRVAEENINQGNICIEISTESVQVNGIYTTKVKACGKIQDVRDLIEQDVRAWKRKPRSNEGKLQMNNKDEQKILLNGRSPDFGDNILMRKWIDIAMTDRGTTAK